MTSVLLINPKHAHNVGQALRACALLGARTLYWTGDRVPAPDKWPEGARLPREERLRLYRNVRMEHHDSWAEVVGRATWSVPVAVEKLDESERLFDFVHPDVALYVFGPEDGSIPKGARHGCHRFVRIPTAGGMENVPYGLGGAVHITLYDRLAKMPEAGRRSLYAAREGGLV